MTGVILEIASGSGDHIVHFAKNFAALVFQPSDPEPDPLLSIAAWMKATGATNVRAPIALAGVTFGWPIASANGYNRSDTEQLRIRPAQGQGTNFASPAQALGHSPHVPQFKSNDTTEGCDAARLCAARFRTPTQSHGYSGPDELMVVSGLPCAA
jgi:hypothetical protein